MQLKKFLISTLKDLITRLESDECKLSDQIIFDIMEFAQKCNDEQKPLTKSEVAEMLHCTTKTIERMISDGRFPNGRKRVGHKTLYWTLYDVKQYISSTKSRK